MSSADSADKGPVAQSASPRVSDTSPKTVDSAPPPKPLMTPWSAIVKAKDAAPAVQKPKSSKSDSTGDSEAKSSAPAAKSGASGASQPAADAVKSSPTADAKADTSAAKATAASRTNAEDPKSTGPATEQAKPVETKTPEQVEASKPKAAWKVPTATETAPKEAAAPLAENVVTWPSLGDSKDPLSKKKLRQQTIVPPPSSTATTTADKPKKGRGNRQQGSLGDAIKTDGDNKKSSGARGRNATRAPRSTTDSAAPTGAAAAAVPAPPPPAATGPSAATAAPTTGDSAVRARSGSRDNKFRNRNNNNNNARGPYNPRSGPPIGPAVNAPAFNQSFAGGYMYSVGAPVFYPPAAYGVPPAVVGMPNATPVDSLLDAIKGQIEYYFSVGNLVKDIFLRGKMNSGGWIPLHTIASFNRVRMLTPDPSLIITSLKNSPIVEVSGDELYLRPKENWASWVLPEEQRDKAAHVQAQQLQVAAAAEAAAAAALQQQRRTKAAPKVESSAATNGSSSVPAAAPPAAVKKDVDVELNEDDMFEMDEDHDATGKSASIAVEEGQSTLSDLEVSRLIVVKPSMRSPQKPELAAADMANVINDGLELYARELRNTKAAAKEMPKPPRPARNIANFYPASLPKGAERRQRSVTSSGKTMMSPPSVAVGWVLGSTPPTHGADFGGRSLGTSMGTSAPINKFQHPSYTLLEDNGFTEMKYEKFYARCIQDRSESGIGLSDEMNTLFRFWSYFLRDHFNQTMYDDFKKYACEDSSADYMYGMECLFRFYSYGLEKAFRADLYREFEEMALRDFKSGSLYGLEKFWAYHKYSGIPKDQQASCEMNPELKKLLTEDFKSLDDFKAKASQYKPHPVHNHHQPHGHKSGSYKAANHMKQANGIASKANGGAADAKKPAANGTVSAH